jgi:hypothetical protein
MFQEIINERGADRDVSELVKLFERNAHAAIAPARAS